MLHFDFLAWTYIRVHPGVLTLGVKSVSCMLYKNYGHDDYGGRNLCPGPIGPESSTCEGVDLWMKCYWPQFGLMLSLATVGKILFFVFDNYLYIFINVEFYVYLS